MEKNGLCLFAYKVAAKWCVISYCSLSHIARLGTYTVRQTGNCLAQIFINPYPQ